MSLYINRLPEVLKQSGHPRSTLYFKIKKGLFPKPVRLGERSVGWPEHEVQVVNAAYIAGRSLEEIKTLVSDLESKREELLSGTSFQSKKINSPNSIVNNITYTGLQEDNYVS